MHSMFLWYYPYRKYIPISISNICTFLAQIWRLLNWSRLSTGKWWEICKKVLEIANVRWRLLVVGMVATVALQNVGPTIPWPKITPQRTSCLDGYIVARSWCSDRDHSWSLLELSKWMDNRYIRHWPPWKWSSFCHDDGTLEPVQIGM